jgi:hypothetical protein
MRGRPDGGAASHDPGTDSQDSSLRDCFGLRVIPHKAESSFRVISKQDCTGLGLALSDINVLIRYVRLAVLCNQILPRSGSGNRPCTS